MGIKAFSSADKKVKLIKSDFLPGCIKHSVFVPFPSHHLHPSPVLFCLCLSLRVARAPHKHSIASLLVESSKLRDCD